MNRLFCLCLSVVLLAALPMWGQIATRNGEFQANLENSPLNVGCGGNSLLWADFETGIPAGWSIIDGDTLDPMPTTGMVRGWQVRQDYRDTSNQVLANCSFTSPAGKCDDWFISPLVTLGPNGCLSWKVYSQDNYYLESYEIWVANATDTASLMAGTKVYSITGASASVSHLSVDLSAFNGQTIAIGFHHTSNDKFVLALDDIRLTSRFEPDAWAYQIDTAEVLAFQTVYPELVVVNAGTDTLTSFLVHFQVNGGTVYTTNRSGLVLGTGDSVRVIHDSAWIPAGIGSYNLCMWVSAPNGLTDEYAANDTLCHYFNVTAFIGLDYASQNSVSLFPTITVNRKVHVSGLSSGQWIIYDQTGKTLAMGGITEEILLPAYLCAGMYLIQLVEDSGLIRNFRIIIP